MICSLCCRECIKCKNLFNTDGGRSAIYLVAVKYFAEQLRDLDISNMTQFSSRVICDDCWIHITEFHKFREMILVTREEYTKLMGFEEVKEEMDFDLTSPLCDLKEEFDPVEIIEKVEIPQITKCIFEDNSSDRSQKDLDFSSDDDIPLLSRISKRTTKRAPNEKDDHINKCIDGASKKSNKAKKMCSSNGKRDLKASQLDDFIAEQLKGELHCGICEYNCKNFRALQKHFREEHNNDKAYVLCCQRKFFHRIYFAEHLRTHIDPDYFKCTICGKCSLNRRTLAVHMRTAHEEPLEKKFECEICNKRFTKKCVLKAHKEIHIEGSKDYVCDYCNKGFVLQSRLNIHVRNVHNKTNSSVCELCGKSCRNPYVLKQHLLLHEGVEKKKWPCDQCDAQLHSKYSLRRHKRAHHDGSTAYVCSDCGKVALTEDALRSHKKYMHETERKYKCNICDKAFKVALVLKEHMTTHTGMHLYSCPHCPKTFKVNANMHHHRKRVHRKEFDLTRQRRILTSQADLSLVSNEVRL